MLEIVLALSQMGPVSCSHLVFILQCRAKEVAFSPDGKLMAVAYKDIFLWDISGQKVSQFHSISIFVMWEGTTIC